MTDVRKTSGSRALVYDLSQARSRVAAATAAPGADSAGITEEARELSRAQAAVEASSGVRAERVRALKQQIARGEYNPDPREVAKKILEQGL